MPISWTVACVVTNTMTTDAYRGAGRPEAIYYLERIIDAYAHEIGMDPLEVRRKNFWQPDEFPATMGCGFALDSGNYEAAVDKLIALPTTKGCAGGRRGPGRGPGSASELAHTSRCAGSARRSWPTSVLLGQLRAPASFNGSGLVRVNPDATVTVIGTGPTGQGHETTWAQIVGDGLGSRG